jgi:hypothetical protein
MMLFQDGSTHRWIAALDRDLDLMVTLDDATGAIYSAILVEQEGTASSFLSLAETIAKKGLFRALYTDRGSHYFHTPKAGWARAARICSINPGGSHTKSAIIEKPSTNVVTPTEI